MLADLRASGAPEQIIEEARSATRDSAFRLHPDNRHAWDILRDSGPAWRFAPTGQILGVDRQSLWATMQMHRQKPKRRKRILQEIGLIEHGITANKT